MEQHGTRKQFGHLARYRYPSRYLPGRCQHEQRTRQIAVCIGMHTLVPSTATRVPVLGNKVPALTPLQGSKVLCNIRLPGYPGINHLYAMVLEHLNTPGTIRYLKYLVGTYPGEPGRVCIPGSLPGMHTYAYPVP
jgi:hypothetical protein